MEPDYGVYLDEITERVSENYDPYEYIEELELDLKGLDRELEEFIWEADDKSV